MEHMVYFKKSKGLMSATPFIIMVGQYEISVAGDDSCGGLPEFSRMDVAVFRDNENVTYKILNDTFIPINSFEELIDIFNKVVAYSE